SLAAQRRGIAGYAAERLCDPGGEHAAHLVHTFDEVAECGRIAVPVFQERIRTGRSHEAAECQTEQIEIVDPAEHPEEIGNEVERSQHVHGHRAEQRLVEAGYAGVAQQPEDELEEVGQLANERASGTPAAAAPSERDALHEAASFS